MCIVLIAVVYCGLYAVCMYLVLQGVDKPFTGGIGSFKVYVMLTYILLRTPIDVLLGAIGDNPSPTNARVYSNSNSMPPLPLVDLGSILLQFLEYFGDNSHLNQTTHLTIYHTSDNEIESGGNRNQSENCTHSDSDIEIVTIDFSATFNVNYCAYVLKCASIMLQSVMESQMVLYNMAERNLGESKVKLYPLLGFILHAKKLVADRTAYHRKALGYSQFASAHGHKFRSEEHKNEVANDILLILYRHLKSDMEMQTRKNQYAVFDKVTIEDIKPLNPLLYTRLRSYIDIRSAIQGISDINMRTFKQIQEKYDANSKSMTVVTGDDAGNSTNMPISKACLNSHRNAMANGVNPIFANTNLKKYNAQCEEISGTDVMGSSKQSNDAVELESDGNEWDSGYESESDVNTDSTHNSTDASWIETNSPRDKHEIANTGTHNLKQKHLDKQNEKECFYDRLKASVLSVLDIIKGLETREGDFPRRSVVGQIYNLKSNSIPTEDRVNFKIVVAKALEEKLIQITGVSKEQLLSINYIEYNKRINSNAELTFEKNKIQKMSKQNKKIIDLKRKSMESQFELDANTDLINEYNNSIFDETDRNPNAYKNKKKKLTVNTKTKMMENFDLKDEVRSVQEIIKDATSKVRARSANRMKTFYGGAKYRRKLKRMAGV